MKEPEKPLHVIRDRYPEPIYPTSVAPSVERPRPPGEDTDSNHLREYLNILLARRYTILAVLVTVVTISMIQTYKETPIYRATALIQIDRDSARILKIDPIDPASQQDDVLQTQYRLLASKSLAREVIQALHLDRKPAASAPQAEPQPSFLRAWASGVKKAGNNLISSLFSSNRSSTAAGAEPTSVPREPSQDDDPLRPYVNRYLGSISVSPITRTRHVNVSFDGPDPRLAALIINKHAELFVEQNMKAKFDATQKALKFLEGQLSSTKAAVEKAEDALQQYSTQHQILFLAEGKNSDVEKLVQLDEEYTKSVTDRIGKGSVAKLLREQGGPTDPAADTRLGELEREDAKLRVTYKEDYEPRKVIRSQIAAIEKQIEIERKAAIKRADADFAAARDREEQFRQEFEKQRARVDAMKEGLVQYQIKKRDADFSRGVYDMLLGRLKEAEVTRSLEASNIRVVDRADLPGGPIRPEKNKALLNSLALGLALGIGLAFFQEYMDSSIKSPDDIMKHLKLPTLAIIPRLGSVSAKGKGGYGYGGYGGYVSSYFTKKEKVDADAPPADPNKAKLMELVTHEDPSSLVSEAYRSLRASLILSAPDRPPRVILVTSSVPSEGKTSTAANLAVSLTQIGAKVLLIDGDMRKPRQDKIFDLQQRSGLSNFLTGTEQFREVIHETAVPNLFLIPCGVIPPNPSELILSNRLKQMLEVLRKHFDYVLIDSPPLTNVSDARIYAPNVDAILVVVKALSTSRHVVARAIAHMEENRSRIVGVVLNDYDVKTKGGYYYSYGAGQYAQEYAYRSEEAVEVSREPAEKD